MLEREEPNGRSTSSDRGRDDGGPANLDAFLDVTLDVRVELGRARISIERATRLREGSILELDRMAGDPLDIVVNGRVVARGEAVVVGDHLGVRIVEIVGTAGRR